MVRFRSQAPPAGANRSSEWRPACAGDQATPGDLRAAVLYNGIMRLHVWPTLIALAAVSAGGGPARAQSTVVGIRGSQFTINGRPTYTPESGFPNANANRSE